MGTLVAVLIVVGLVSLVCWATRRAEVAERIAAADARPDPAPAVRAGDVFGPLAASRLPQRPAPRGPMPPADDATAVRVEADLLIAGATALCRRDAEIQANAALMDEYATRYPLKQRPRLVEQAASEINPLVEN